MNNRDPWPADKSDWAGDAQMLGQSVCRFESLSTAPTAEKGEDLRIAKRWNVENAVSKGIRFTWDTSCCGALGCLHGQFSHHTGHKFSWEASRASSCASSSSSRGIFWGKQDRFSPTRTPWGTAGACPRAQVLAHGHHRRQEVVHGHHRRQDVAHGHHRRQDVAHGHHRCQGFAHGHPRRR